MFTIRDLCDIAVQIERNGEAVYRQAGEVMADPEIEALLHELAEDEKRHANWFENIDFSHTGTYSHAELENAGRELLQGMMENQTFSLDASKLTRSEKIEKVISQSITFERDTILFYEMLSGFIDDEKVLRQLEEIIREEQSHVVKLKGMLFQQK